ncbi:MAG TPA: hypothetical protein VFC01_12235 [Mycobacterium sp.]|nr:hypothetical protein [Mycobacterium sp.]
MMRAALDVSAVRRRSQAPAAHRNRPAGTDAATSGTAEVVAGSSAGDRQGYLGHAAHAHLT